MSNWQQKAKAAQEAKTSQSPTQYGGVYKYHSEVIRLHLDVEARALQWRNRTLEKTEAPKKETEDD
jgi:hypothetical protein